MIAHMRPSTARSAYSGHFRIALIRPVEDRLNQATWDTIQVSDFPAAFLPSECLPTVLKFDPGDAVQVDSGRGSTIEDVFMEQTIATWIFVMVIPMLLCYTQGQPLGNFQGGL